jgi:1-acyl-sn-glycerol-3-phosphate acyltransferase
MPRPIFDDLYAPRDHRWRRVVFRWGLWNIVHRFWLNLQVDGWENIPREGPVIIMGNHISNIDPVVMISFWPGRDVVPIAKIEAFHMPFLRYFVGHWGAIPVKRGSGDMRSLKLALRHIIGGDVVMVYAEGTRSKTGLLKGESGVAYLATKTDALVVPAATWGGRDFPFTWWRSFRRTQVRTVFGPPFRFRYEGRRSPREHFQRMTDEAMYRIAALLPPGLRGVYADVADATTDFLDFDVTWQPPPAGALPARAHYPVMAQRDELGIRG